MISVNTTVYNLSENLLGKTIGNWYISKKLSHKSSTGGNFSVGYEATNIIDSTKGFFKALDYSSIFEKPNFAENLNAMTSAYLFERELLNKCKDKNLKYVIRILDSGEYSLPIDERSNGFIHYPHINYLVFEIADRSMRNIIDLSKAFDYSWALRSLHNIAVAVEEMHGIQIAHQDIKPSNILLFDNKNKSKLGDVGRSSSMETPAWHDRLNYAGDSTYSPFEQLYGYIDPDWKTRRFSCDMFMFGNLIMTYFNNVSITSAVLNKLQPSCYPLNWPDTYQTILPQINNKFSECLNEFNHNIDTELRDELINMIKQLCHPDLSLRGDMKNKKRGAQQYSLTRFISKLDLLARKYEYQYKKVII